MSGKKFSFNRLSGKDGDFENDPDTDSAGSGSDDDDNKKVTSGSEPITTILYDFLIEPTSSTFALIWNVFSLSIVTVYFIIVWLESLNGPNKFVGRIDRSTFPLPTEDQYYQVKLICQGPLLLDFFMRVLLVYAITTRKKNKTLYYDIFLNQDNLSDKALLYGDLLGGIPFLIDKAVFLPFGQTLKDYPEFLRAIFRGIEILNFSRLLRYFKNTPALRAIRLALYKSGTNLILPVFFFALFNVTAGVLMFFTEPCFDETVCPWHDLFEASYFTVVSMTTVGYGDQYPDFEIGRFFALFVCFFGVLFVSMPLAIIGNEYEAAWGDVMHQILEEKRVAAQETRDKESQAAAYRQRLAALDKGDKEKKKGATLMDRLKNGSMVVGKSKVASNKKREKILERGVTNINELVKEHNQYKSCKSLHLMTAFASMKKAAHTLHREYADTHENNHFMNPGVIMGITQARDALFQLIIQTENALDRTHSNMSDEAYEAALQQENGLHDGGYVHRHKHQNQDERINLVEDKMDEVNETIQNSSKSSHVNNSHLDRSSWAQQGRSQSVFMKNRHLLGETEKRIVNLQKNLLMHMDKNDVDDDIKVYTDIPIVSELLRYVRKKLIFYGILSEPVVPDKSDSKKKNGKKINKKKDTEVLHWHERVLLERLEEVKKQPDALSNRIWVLLEIPTSSKEAKAVRTGILFAIIFSVFVLYTETLTSLTNYGEGTIHCQRVMERYCFDKTIDSDPGCFVQDSFGGPSNIQLRFNCEDSDCFGQENNFGTAPGNTNMTCAATSTLQAFATQDELVAKYGFITVFDGRDTMQYKSTLCNRIECRLNGKALFDAKKYWIYAEAAINILFSLELAARIASSGSISNYFSDTMNLLDLAVVVPYYVDLSRARSQGVAYSDMDFSILPTLPEAQIFVILRTMKVARLFKLSRHFKESRVLIETAAKAWKPILGVIILLIFITFVFSVILYEVEAGIPCFVGDEGCQLKDDIVPLYKHGQRVVLNKFGDISQFTDVFVCVWFSFVTVTTVGYGDISPITNAGKIFAVFLMLAGSMYMSIPLTVAGNVYYETHAKYMTEEDLATAHHRKEIAMQVAAASAAIEESLKGSENGVKTETQSAIDALVSTASELNYVQAMSMKKRQNQLLKLHGKLHTIANDLLKPIHGTYVSEDEEEGKESLRHKLKRIVHELHQVSLSSKGVFIKLAETLYCREEQLHTLIINRQEEEYAPSNLNSSNK